MTLTLILIQGLLTGCALVMSYWAKIPWLGLLGLACLGGSAIAAQLAPAAWGGRFWKSSTVVAWVCTLMVPLSFWLMPDSRFTVERLLDHYYAILAWLMAAMILPASHRVLGVAFKTRWRQVMMAWALAGNFVWLATAYLENQWWAFHFGLLLALALLILCKLNFHLGASATYSVNTLILIAIGVPLSGLYFHPDHRITNDPAVLKQYRGYRAASQNRDAFEQWWDYYGTAYHQMELTLLIKDPNAPVPIRPRANSHFKLFQSEISINGTSFRGREISENKGDAYRIIAIGESTTFGITLDRDDKPWPELLEQLIRVRLKPDRPIEVINAGIPGITLPENLKRFSDEILPLKPNMIICYHGINGFPLLDDAMPSLRDAAPPKYWKRPVRLLADCEYNLKLLAYKHSHKSKLFLKSPAFSNLTETKYARAYEQLIQTAISNKIRLVIANFPLAVNRESPPDVADFFRPLVPSPVYWYVNANVAHDQMVRQLARQHGEVRFVDVQPQIDGQEEKYIDLMHLTQEGDRQLAENFFAGIRAVLEADLAASPRESEPQTTK